MESVTTLLAIDPLGLGLGLFLIITAAGSFIARERVAEQLARSYAQRSSPQWVPAIFSKRFGLRETRVLAVLVAALLVSVGCWFTVAALVSGP